MAITFKDEIGLTWISRAAIGVCLLWTAPSMHAQMTNIVTENFGGGGSLLNARIAPFVTNAITAAGGSNAWLAADGFKDNGSVISTTTASGSASLNLGNYINSAKGTPTGYFELKMTISPTVGSGWISFGFAAENTPGTNANFTSGSGSSPSCSGLGTVIYRANGSATSPFRLDMYGVGNLNPITGPNASGNRTLTVILDLTPGSGYGGLNNFGTVTWVDSVLGVLGNHTYTSETNFGSILISQTSGTNGANSNLTLAQTTTATIPVLPLFTDTGSPPNPLWSEIFPTLNDDTGDPGPVPGSVINVNNAAVEVGLYGKRPISVGNQKIHVPCNTSAGPQVFKNFTRWFQTDGNTQVIRLFVNDENTATPRIGAARCEAFTGNSWNYNSNMTYEWTGRFTVARRQQVGISLFQIMNSENEWAVQIFLKGDGSVEVRNRRNLEDVLVTNSDGSVKNFDGLGFDFRVLDDGHNFKLWIDGVLYSDNFYSRPTGNTNFRWGSYCGANVIQPPAEFSLILVSGAQVKSWPGNMSTATTTVVKANNTTNLENTASWTGAVVPGLYQQAIWNSTVTAANTTTLASDQNWAGIRIVNPGGLVTLNGAATLGLDDSGVDMSAATQSLVVNCPVELTESGPWVVAAGPTATFNGVVRGHAGFTLSGGGTLVFNATNSYTGPTIISAGTLKLGAANIIPDGSTTKVMTLNGTLDLNTYSETVSGLTGTGTVDTLAGGTPTFTVNNPNGVNTAFGGSITNSVGAFVKDGIAAFRLFGTNGYSGDTIIRSGQLRAGSVGSIPTGAGKGNLVLSPASDNTAVFDVNGFNLTVNGLSSSGAVGICSVTNAPALATTNTLTIGNNHVSSTFAGPIGAASGSLLNITKIGSGTLTLSGANTYNSTLVSAGTLQLGAAEVIPDGSGTKLLTLNGTLDLNTYSETVSGLTGIGTVHTVAGGTPTFTVNNPSGVNTAFGGTITNGAGTLTFVKDGVAALRLFGTNGYSGDTVIRSGQLRAGSVGSIPSGAGKGNLVMNPASGNTAAFDVNGFNLTINGLSNSGAVGPCSVTNAPTSATINTLTIGSNDASSTFAGPIGSAVGSVLNLTKIGSGTLTLSGTNTYTGDTTVSQGILSLGIANTNNQPSTFTLAATGATLNLTFSGTDTVAKLFIGATPKPAGVYGAIGSVMPVIGTAQITGTGTLTVTSGPTVTGYAAWQNMNGSSQVINGDHDNDGVPNGIEYFIGGSSGNTTGFTALPGVVVSGAVLSVTWNKNTAYLGNYGTDFFVETAATLNGTWTVENAAPFAGATVSFPTPTTVKYIYPNPLPTRKFVRLKVTGP